jgi:methyltransferase (TIGR00027 family)
LIGELGVEKLREQLQKGMPGVPQYMWCRTRVIDSELHRLIISADPPIQQLVILGAGYDTRCIRFFAGLHHHKIARFEIDRAEMQAEKRERLEEIVREAELVQSGQPHLSEAVKAISFQSFDLSQPKKELLTTLVHTSFRTNHVTLFIWEGVVMYLTKKDVEETLEFMHNAAAPGSRLLCDFTQKQEDPIQEHIERSLAKKGEPIQFLTDPSEFSDLLSRKGWGVERMFTPDVLRKEYATEDEFEQGGKEWAGANVVLAKRV